MAWSFLARTDRNKQQKSKQHRRRHLGILNGRRPRFEELERRQMLAVLTVNTNDGGPANHADGLLSIREALEVVNNGSTATLVGAELTQVNSTTPLGTNDTVGFSGVASPITLTGGALTIDGSVTINGPGKTLLTIKAGAAARIFDISAGAGDVTIKGLTLDGGAPAAGNGGAINSVSTGKLTVADSDITGSKTVAATTNGGGIYASGDLVLSGVTIGGAGALANTATGKGGGVYAGGKLTVTNSTITGNSAANGGGIYGVGNIDIDHSKVAANTTTGKGGGIFAFGNVNVTNSTIGGIVAADANRAANGGGIFGTTVTVQNSAVSGNSTNGSFDGGGIYATKSVVVRNSTISGNEADEQGGGIFTPAGGAVTLINSTVASNTSDIDGGGSGSGGGVVAGARLTVQNSIIMANIDNSTGSPNPDFIKGTVSNEIKFSLIGDAKGTAGVAGTETPGPAFTPNAKGNIVGNSATATGIIPIASVLDQTAGVANLKDNNAPQPATTPTIALSSPTSLAKDKGRNSLAAPIGSSDQRGFPFVRIFNGTVDMGAFEDQPPAPLNNAPTVANPIPAQTAVVGTAFVFTFAVNTFTDLDNDPLTYTATLSPTGALPAWITTFPNGTVSRTFAGVPAAGDVGTITVRVTASDGKGGTTSTDFTLTVVAAELPFSENFNNPVPPGQVAPDARIKEKIPSITTTTVSPLEGTGSLQATRLTVGTRPLATVDFASPATAPLITNISVNVSPQAGNGTTLWSNAVVAYDYQSPTNYKFAGYFAILKKLIIGQVVNGKVTYLAQKAFTTALTSVPLNVAINRTTKQVTLSSGATSIAFTHATLGTGTVGVGTINANAKFDSLLIS
jgi:predicted outer membrane repeat protein